MSRNFNGGMPPTSGGSKTKASDAIKEAMFKAKTGGGKTGGRYSNKPDYKEQMKQRIEDYKSEMMKEAGAGRKVALPGTDPDQQQGMSDNAKKALEAMAERKAQKEAKKQKKKDKIEAHLAKKKAMEEKFGTGPGLKAFVGGKAVDARELEDSEREKQAAWDAMYSRKNDDNGW